ncbi:hypothetical protein NBRC116602_06350 [Hyphomicrobiales bacterium 4NK60-0047b]|jgi:hypothetical protein
MTLKAFSQLDFYFRFLKANLPEFYGKKKVRGLLALVIEAKSRGYPLLGWRMGLDPNN